MDVPLGMWNAMKSRTFLFVVLAVVMAGGGFFAFFSRSPFDGRVYPTREGGNWDQQTAILVQKGNCLVFTRDENALGKKIWEGVNRDIFALAIGPNIRLHQSPSWTLSDVVSGQTASLGDGIVGEMRFMGEPISDRSRLRLFFAYGSTLSDRCADHIVELQSIDRIIVRPEG